MCPYYLQKIFLLKSTWGPLHLPVAIRHQLFKRNQTFSQRPSKEIMLILFGILPTVKQPEFWWTHLPYLSCVLSFHFASYSSLHTRSRMPEELCLLVNPLLLHRASPFCFPRAFPRHGYPADPTGTSCSSHPGRVGWLKGFVANTCSSDTEEHNGRVPDPVHRTRATTSRHYQTWGPTAALLQTYGCEKTPLSSKWEDGRRNKYSPCSN